MTIDRSHVARCLAKAIAHKNAGNDTQAHEWACELIVALDCADILIHTNKRRLLEGGG